MARLRPSWVFRRLSSRDSRDPAQSPRTTTTATATTSSSSISPPVSASAAPGALPTPKLSAHSLATPPPSSKRLRKSTSLPKLRKKLASQERTELQVPESVEEKRESVLLPEAQAEQQQPSSDGDLGQPTRDVSTADLSLDKADISGLRNHPLLVVHEATPDADAVTRRASVEHRSSIQTQEASSEGETIAATPSPSEQLPETPPAEEPARHAAPVSQPASPAPESAPTPRRPTHTNIRKQSITDSANVKIVKTLIDVPTRSHDSLTHDSSALPTGAAEFFANPGLHHMTAMLHRKIWVKRPGASATLVQIKEDDLVDDVRDFILRKYANSLGKTFDAPDMTLNIITRSQHGEQRTERLLGPEEEICRTIDAYYPGGQTVDEALVIHVPQRRTPRHSPRVPHPGYYASEDFRPLENGTDYFPPMPAVIPPTLPQTTASEHSRPTHHQSHLQHPLQPLVVATGEHPRSISVLNTGQVPPLPSPGARSARHHRPKMQRQPTSSPTILSHPTTGAVAIAPSTANPPHLVHRPSARPRLDSSTSDAHRPSIAPAPPPLPTPPAPEAASTNPPTSNPPTPSAGSLPPRSATRFRRSRRPTPEKLTKSRHSRQGSASGLTDGYGVSSMLDGSVPPINVLIVEDNIINMRILEGLMKRLKVRWQTAMNGQIAVDKWREGGFHLVLMDIQMPVMNGLQATKEIRRLERVNGIGVFSSSSSAATSPDENGTSSVTDAKEHNPADDKLPTSKTLFKSPIIIVALTASSLQSDRHEALAAGCNDFLTKPVNFVWLERKVKEWGCMQALIDFDGWRQWKAFAEEKESGKSEEEKRKDREKEEKDRIKAEKLAKLQEKQAQRRAEQEKEKERKKRASLQGGTNGDAAVGVNGDAQSIAEE